MKTSPSLQELEGYHFCCLTLGEVCHILPIVRRQVAVNSLYKWSEDEDGMVDDVIEKENIYYLMFQCQKRLGMG